MAKNYTADIVIAGAGLVGSCLSLLLAKAGLKIILLDAISFKPHTDKAYDLRVSSITPASVNIFKTVKVWDAIQAIRVSPFAAIDVWQESSNVHLHFNAKDMHRTELGFIIENSLMQNALFDAINRNENINVLAPIQIDNFEVNQSHVEIQCASSEMIKTKLLVGADGTNSHIRQLGNFVLDEKSYNQKALVGMIQTSLPHHKIARQRFLNSGPLAFLPLLDEHHCSFVWSHAEKEAEDLAQMPAVEFNTALQDAIGSVLGEVRIISDRKIFPLIKRHVKNYVKERVALIGDCAHTVHPLAGQGLNLGLADALSLSSIISHAVNENRDIGLMHTLRKFERERKAQNQIMLNVIDAFHHLFQKRSSLYSLARNLGFQMTEHCLPLKKIIMRCAMGI